MSYPFVAAANYSPGGNTPVTRIVIHDEEYPEKPTSAEEVAQFFHNQPRNSSGSSAHLVVDNNSIVQCVHFTDRAWHAPPNGGSIGLEHSGYSHETRDEWLDPYGIDMLHLSAAAVAQLCHQFDIPIVKLSVADLLAGKRGICGHADVSAAWHQSTHTDPGPSFPWDLYLPWVREAFGPHPITEEEEDDMLLILGADGVGALYYSKDFTRKASIPNNAALAAATKGVEGKDFAYVKMDAGQLKDVPMPNGQPGL